MNNCEKSVFANVKLHGSLSLDQLVRMLPNFTRGDIIHAVLDLEHSGEVMLDWDWRVRENESTSKK